MSAVSFNILITGYRGYIGSALYQYLLDKAPACKIIGYDIVEGDDIMDFNKLVTVMQRENISLVIHLAALSSVTACNENLSLAVRINAEGTHKILKAMAVTNCQRIIYASTSSVYGNSEHLPYTEGDTPMPCSAYGSSKLLGEVAIHEHNPNSYLIYRMFNVVGTSGYPEIDNNVHPGYDRLFGALQSGKVTIYGSDYKTTDGTCERDYISLKDVCDAYLAGIVQMAINNNLRDTVNVCTGTSISVKGIIKAWNEVSHGITSDGLHLTTCIELPYITPIIGKRRAGDPAIVYGSNDKAKQLLMWQSSRKIDEIIFDISIDKKI